MHFICISSYCRDLAEKHRTLLRRFDADSRAMKRLSMDNEQLAWRLSQSALDTASGSTSTSPPSEIGSTPDMLRLMSSMTRLPTSPGATSGTPNHHVTSMSNFRRQRPKSMVALSQSTDNSVKLRRPLGASTARNIGSIKQSDV